MLDAITSYWVTWFPGAMLALLGVLTLCWKAVAWLVNSANAIKEIRVALPQLQAEFSPNSGHSLKDRVEALHVKQDDAADQMGRHILSDQRAFARQDRFNRRVEAAVDRIEDHLR